MRRGYGEREVEYLFYDYDLYQFLEARRAEMLAAIAKSDGSQIKNESLDALVEDFVAGFSLDTPRLTDAAVSVHVEEAQVDVSNDPNRFIFDEGPHYVAGIRATYFVPFAGNQELFRCRPSTCTTVLPFVQSIGKGELTMSYDRPDTNVSATKSQFEKDFAAIKQYLQWVEVDVQKFNAGLSLTAKKAIEDRQRRIQQMEAGTESLGIRIHRPGSTGPATGKGEDNHIPKRREPPPELYDVALSFAGENRPYVDEVAKRLRDAGVSVFYDDFEKVQLWGKNLVDHFAEVYQRRSRYVVMFISEHYVRKAWPNHERQQAQARSILAKEEYILPARFDDTDVPGMTSTVAHVDLRGVTPEDFIKLILAKLGKPQK